MSDGGVPSGKEPVIPRFLYVVAHAVGGHDGRMLGDVMTEKLLTRLVHWTLVVPTGGKVASERVLAKTIGAFGVPRGHVHRRLRVLARFGIIRVRNTWDRSKRVYTTNLIEVNPALEPYLAGRRSFKTREMQRFAKWSAHVGAERAKSDPDLQGFDEDHLYATPPPGQAPDVAPVDGQPPIDPAFKPVEPGGGFYAEEDERQATHDIWAEVQSDTKEAKRRDDADWRRKSRQFVRGAARVWNAYQKSRGRADVMPSWDGDPAHLAPTVRRQQQDLIRIFQAEGGLRACAAWYLYNSCYIPKNAKLQFSRDTPHIDWVTDDKRPESFAKYFNAVVADPDMVYVETDERMLNNLKIAFTEEIVNSSPRYSKTQAIGRVIDAPKQRREVSKSEGHRVSPVSSAPSGGSPNVP